MGRLGNGYLQASCRFDSREIYGYPLAVGKTHSTRTKRRFAANLGEGHDWRWPRIHFRWTCLPEYEIHLLPHDPALQRYSCRLHRCSCLPFVYLLCDGLLRPSHLIAYSHSLVLDLRFQHAIHPIVRGLRCIPCATFVHPNGHFEHHPSVWSAMPALDPSSAGLRAARDSPNEPADVHVMFLPVQHPHSHVRRHDHRILSSMQCTGYGVDPGLVQRSLSKPRQGGCWWRDDTNDEFIVYGKCGSWTEHVWCRWNDRDSLPG